MSTTWKRSDNFPRPCDVRVCNDNDACSIRKLTLQKMQFLNLATKTAYAFEGFTSVRESAHHRPSSTSNQNNRTGKHALLPWHTTEWERRAPTALLWKPPSRSQAAAVGRSVPIAVSLRRRAYANRIRHRSAVSRISGRATVQKCCGRTRTPLPCCPRLRQKSGCARQNARVSIALGALHVPAGRACPLSARFYWPGRNALREPQQ